MSTMSKRPHVVNNGLPIAGAHASMSPSELGYLTRLNEVYPDGAIEGDPESWPSWTDDLAFTLTPRGLAVCR